MGMSKKACLYLILAMLLGPLLAVNGILKEFSGRARPRHVVEFSGHKTFTPLSAAMPRQVSILFHWPCSFREKGAESSSGALSLTAHLSAS